MSRGSTTERSGPAPVILAIETSTVLLGVSVVRGEQALIQDSLAEPRVHSAMLLPMCLKAMGAAGCAPEDLSAVAVSAGPGSFTGLRIGCATAQGLAKAWDKEVVLVPTFEALLSRCEGHPVVALVQGRAKAQTVTALYEMGEQGFVEVIPAAARGVDEFFDDVCSRAEQAGGRFRVAVAGDAADLFVSSGGDKGRKRWPGLEIYPVDESARLPSPAAVGFVAARMWREGNTVRPGEAVPRYYRKSQAEALAAAKKPPSPKAAEVNDLESPLEIQIDKMALQDLDRVLEIEALSYHTPWSRRAFTSEVSENSYAHYFAARHDGRIIGYVGMWVILDEAHITNIAVDPQYRRNRVAQRLLEAMFEKAKGFGANRMTLEVRVSNLGAQTLYRKLGFVDRGMRKGYYTDTNEDAIIMWKDDLGPQKAKVDQVKWMV